MGLAEQQNIEKRPVVEEPWSFKRLFPMKAMANALAKTMFSLFDYIFVYLILVISFAELIGHRVSWMMWIFTVLIFLAVLSERNKESKQEK